MPSVSDMLRDMINRDHEHIHLTVNVLVQQPGDGGSFEVSHALRFNRGNSLGNDEVGLPSGTVVFALWVDQCDSRPRLSATLTDLDEDVEYKVLAVDDVAAYSRYDVTCIKKVGDTAGG